MRQARLKRLAALSPRLEESKVVVAQRIQHLEAVKPVSGEAKALVNRMRNGTSSESDRQRLLEMLAAEEAARQCLASWPPPRLPSQGHHRKKGQKQRVKRSGRYRGRERKGGLPSRGCCVASHVLSVIPSLWLLCSVEMLRP